MEKTISNFIKSLSIGLITTLFAGYSFTESRYFYNGIEQNYGPDEYVKIKNHLANGLREEEFFNFKLGFIIGGIFFAYFMFIHFDEERKNKLTILYNKFKTTEFRQKLIAQLKEKSTFFKSETLNKKNGSSFLNFFNGRIRRTPFFIYSLIINLFYNSIYAENLTPDIGIIIFIFILLILEIRLTIMRLHDFNFSGWFSLFKFLPYAVIISEFVLKLYFEISSPSVVLFIMIIICGIANLLLTFIPGDKRSNDFGECIY